MRLLKIAHRGASAKRPENTLPAFKQAFHDRADVIEMDVRLSSDNEFILLHDKSVDRTTNGSGLVANMTLQEIQRLDAGNYFSPKFSGVRIPTLREALRTFGKHIYMLLDIKFETDLYDIIRFLEEERQELQCILGLRHIESVIEAKRINPNIRVLGFIPRPHTSEIIQQFVDAGVDIIRLWFDELQRAPDLVKTVHDHNKPVWIMAGDLPKKSLTFLQSLRVDGVLVDDVKIMLD